MSLRDFFQERLLLFLKLFSPEANPKSLSGYTESPVFISILSLTLNLAWIKKSREKTFFLILEFRY